MLLVATPERWSDGAPLRLAVHGRGHECPEFRNIVILTDAGLLKDHLVSVNMTAHRTAAARLNGSGQACGWIRIAFAGDHRFTVNFEGTQLPARFRRGATSRSAASARTFNPRRRSRRREPNGSRMER